MPILEDQAADLNELTKTWFRRCRMSQHAHYAGATRYLRVNASLTWLATILSAIVGTTVFASLESTPDRGTKLFVGVLSILAAIITALQNGLRYADRAERHRAAAASFGNMRRQLEMIYSQRDSLSETDLRASLQAYSDRLSELMAASPAVPSRLYWKAGKLAD